MRSPIAGRMLTRRTKDLDGRFLTAGAPIARVGDTATLKAEIAVTERMLSYLRPGSPVAMQVRARPMRILHGRITRVGIRGADAAREPPTERARLCAPERCPSSSSRWRRSTMPTAPSLPGMHGPAKIALGRRSFLSRSWRVLRHWVQTVIWW